MTFSSYILIFQLTTSPFWFTLTALGGGGHFSLQCEALLSSKIIVEHLTANKTDIYIDRFETRKGVKGEYRTGQVVGLDTTPNE